METGQGVIGRVWGCILKALPKAGKTCLWLLKIILPISLLVRILQYSGILGQISDWLVPVFSLVGLPGETAIVFITSIFSPLYAPIALITSMSLGVREATILALMCLTSQSNGRILRTGKDRVFFLGDDAAPFDHEFRDRLFFELGNAP